MTDEERTEAKPEPVVVHLERLEMEAEDPLQPQDEEKPEKEES